MTLLGDLRPASKLGREGDHALEREEGFGTTKGFVAEAIEGAESIAELCRKYAISRVTGYKGLQRFENEGEAGLEEQSRVPQHCPQAIPEQRAHRILELRREHPRWGPRKLLAYLEARGGSWPAASSIGALLKREGLSHSRPKRARTPPYGDPLAHAEASSASGCIKCCSTGLGCR